MAMALGLTFFWPDAILSFLFVSAVIAFHSILLYLINRQNTRRPLLEIEQRVRLTEEASELRMRAIESLAMAIDAKDQTTPGHVRRTQVYATELGKLLCVKETEMEALRFGALLHDVGKLAVPEYILNKPGRLSTAESEKMKTHASVGGDIVRRINFPFPVEVAVRHHHERWDGSGYPAGLSGEQIPLVARVIAVVDFYDSTRCDRPYRAGMEREESIALLRRMAGTHFDPDIVEMFATNLDYFDSLIHEHDLSEQISSSDENQETRSEGAVSSARQADDGSGFRTIAEAQREVFALHEIIQAVSSSLSLEDMMALVSGKLRGIVPFDECVIYLIDERAGRARAAYALGSHSDFFAGHSVLFGEGVTGWVVANARTMRDTSSELDLTGLPEDFSRQVRSLLACPLVREDGAFGVITLYSSSLTEYSAEHTRLVETVCRHVEGALGSAVIHEKTKLSALTDPLTELPNARSLYATLEQRIAECHRAGSEPLSLLVLNLDNFKSLNELYGHGVGDRLLAAVAGVVKKHLRQMDTLSRFDGDEFIAIMPMASGEVARSVAERVRTAVETHKFSTRTGRETQVRISSGVASFPVDGETSDELLSAAVRDMRGQKLARKMAAGALNSGNVAHLDISR